MEEVVCSWATTAYAWIEARLDWESFRDFGNSTFFTSIAGAFAGAWAGGRIAQILALRSKEKEELAREIRNANAAATIASALCDDLAGFLRQNVLPMKERYDTDLALVTALMAAPPNKNPPTITAELQHLTGPSLHTEPLQQLIFGNISNITVTRLFVTLNQAISNVRSTNETRNRLVEEFRAIPDMDAALQFFYFGFRDPRGRTDDRYKSTLTVLHVSLRDGIYFSMHLALMLAAHAQELARRCKKEFGGPVPKPVKLDFTRLAERGLLPDSKDYPDWGVMLTPPLSKASLFSRFVKRLRTMWEKTAGRLLPR